MVDSVSALHIHALDHRNAKVAAQIHAVMAQAYVQEAALLQVRDFPPLQRTAADVQASADFFLGARWERLDDSADAELLGVLSIGPDDEAAQLCINALTVAPHAQRQGIGRALMQAALLRGQGMDFAVSTAAANAPALALYRGLGFVIYRHGTMGPQALALVKLRRAAC